MSGSERGRAALEVVMSRRSVRAFADEPVPEEVIRRLVEAAHSAPRGGNRPLLRFIAVRDRELLAAMRRAVETSISAMRGRIKSGRARAQFDGYTSHFVHFSEAPAVVIVLARPYDSIYTRIVAKHLAPGESAQGKLVDVPAMSAAAAVENMLLAAEALGWGGCFMTGPTVAQRELEELLEAGEPWHVVALVPIGRPAAEASPREREGLEEVLFFK